MSGMVKLRYSSRLLYQCEKCFARFLVDYSLKKHLSKKDCHVGN